MADVRPFSAWRYATPALDISDVVAPPYDVISAEQRTRLLDASAHNVVALELPEGSPDPEVEYSRYRHARGLWDEWRETGVLAHDEAPNVYVLEQCSLLDGREVRRRAFIVEVGLEPFSAGVVLPHERTLPKALGDRFELIKATGANLSQVFGLFEDREAASERLFSSIMSTEPVSVATDADGVTSTLWACDDESLAGDLSALLTPKRIFIADGHHRYTVALAHRDMLRERDGRTLDEPNCAPYDYVMMALVDMDDPELVVLPTHRVADARDQVSGAELLDRLSGSFELSPLAERSPEEALATTQRPAFVVRVKGSEEALLATLRLDVDLDAAITAQHSHEWKELDVAVLQELILDPIFDIHPDRAETLERLHFVKNAREALAAADGHDAAFVVRPTKLEQLRAVALAGETMPQKSTYFHPKLLSGMLFRDAL